jgi:hypothetical protein
MGKPPWLFYFLSGHGWRRIEETGFPKRGEQVYHFNLTKREEELCNRKLGLDAMSR